MALPFIIMGIAAAASAYGGKKAYDGYQKKSEADDIMDAAKRRFDTRKEKFDLTNDATSNKLERLGKKELEIGQQFNDFNTIARELLAKLAKDGHKDLELTVPTHNLNKIEKLSISALEYLGTVVGAGASGAAAGFAVYSGVMAFAAASTGTPIAALSGVAAYNATMAAIGGGSLAAGGWGMAGGAMVLGGAVVAPLLAIAGWAYNNHAEKALESAQQAAREVSAAISKMDKSEKHLLLVSQYVDRIYDSICLMQKTFSRYFSSLKQMHDKIKAGQTIDDSDSVMLMINNGYLLAAIITDVITTPLFKPKKNAKGEAVITEGVIELQTDAEGINLLNNDELDETLKTSDRKFGHYSA